MDGEPEQLRVARVVWRLTRGGGVPVVVNGVIEHHVDPGLDFRIVAVRGRNHPPDALPAGNLQAVDIADTRRVDRRLHAALGLRRLVRELDPDVTHIDAGMAVYSRAAVIGQRTLVEFHDAPSRGENAKTTLRFAGHIAKRTGSHALVHSRAVRDDLLAFHDLAPDDVSLIHLGVDTQRFRPVGEGRTGIVLWVGRLVPRKQPDWFIQTANTLSANHADITWMMVGAGAPPVRHSPNVTLAGALYNDELVAAYQRADVFVSTSQYEGFGLTVLEAMSCGVPVVAPAVDGTLDVVEDGVSGILVHPSVTEITKAVDRLLSDETLRRQMGRAAASRAREFFDIRQSVNRTTSLYRRLARS